MIMTDISRIEWIKSTYSGGNEGQCVEYSRDLLSTTGVVPVRDSKVPVGPVVMFSAVAWADFVIFVAE